MSTYVPEYHVLSSDDVLPAEGAQSIVDTHDLLLETFQEQHRLGGPFGAVGNHTTWQHLTAVIGLATPEGVANHKPMRKTLQYGIVGVKQDAGGVYVITLEQGSFVRGAKASVISTFTGGPLTAEQMNYLTPAVYESEILAERYIVDFGPFTTDATPTGILGFFVAFYGPKVA